MSVTAKIKTVYGQEIIDSRGNPTVEATVVLDDGTGASASVPSGASTGIHEALELRDGGNRFDGMGVIKAVGLIKDEICPALSGISLCQNTIDMRLCELDGTPDKSQLGANAILAVSLAAAKAAAQSQNIPLYKYIGGITGKTVPVPMMNVLNGGAHAKNNLDVQEFMIVPHGFDSFSEALRAGCEIYHNLGRILSHDGKSTGVGDEGGFAPDLENEDEAIDYLLEAIRETGYSTEQVKLSLDAAVSEWFDGEKYIMPKAGGIYSSDELTEKWQKLCERYPIFSIEDGLGEDDFLGWKKMTEKIGKKVTLVGDDLFVTNISRLKRGIEMEVANAILVKPNQIGTLTETLDVIKTAKQNGYKTIISHRSGETEDTAIADIAIATNAGYIKCGAPCRTDRVAKYNRLLRIENQLSDSAVFGIK